MTNFIDINLIANAGVMVERSGVRLLVDGIHCEDGHPFSKVPEIDLERMRQRAAPFANLDYLLFTHEHPDHFTPSLVLEHLRHAQVKGLFLPDGRSGSRDFSLLLDHVRKWSIPYRKLGLELGRTKRFALADNLAVTVIGAGHMGPQYQDLRNDCLLVSWGGITVLFTGDADHVAKYFQCPLKGVSLDAVFVNPIFYHNGMGQDIINEIFRPRLVVIYHMPFTRDDTMQFTYMVNRDIEKYGRPEMEVHVLGSGNRHIRIYEAL